MLTRAGVFVLVGSVLVGVAGRVLGILELFVLAAVGVILVVVAFVTVRWRPPRIQVDRVVSPARIHAGTASRVELTITNTGESRSPVLGLQDAVSGTAGAHLMISPIRPSASISATYRLPTDRRGLVLIGPLELEQPEPFGLARRRQRVGLEAELTVLPRVVDLAPLPHTSGQDPVAAADRPDQLGRGGDDFYGLRPYVVGDDLRRVHWLSTARTGDLLVRQDEQPRQGRLTVVLDNRRGHADDATFETMVVAAASIVAGARRRGDTVRLRTIAGAPASPTSRVSPSAPNAPGGSTGFDTGFVTGRGQTDALMEHLALVDLEATVPWPAAFGGESRATATSLVAIVGDIRQGDLDAMVTLRPPGSELTIVRIGAHQGQREPATLSRDHARRRVRIVDVADEADLAPAWNQIMLRPLARAR